MAATIERKLGYAPATAADPASVPRPSGRVWVTAALVCVAYFLGTKVGLALTFQPHPISTLWPPNSILLAALVLTAPRHWWLILLAAFPAHLAAQLQGGVPATQVMAWFSSNCSEALIGAGCIRWFVRGPLRFDSFRHVTVFVLFGALLAPFASSFLDVAFVTAIGWGKGSYWELWRMRFFANVLTSLALVPVIVTWVTQGPAALRRASLWRYAEAGVLMLGIVSLGFGAFTYDDDLDASVLPVLVYAPVPFLLWAAVRLGPLGTSASLLTVAFCTIWGVIHGQGPFVATSPADSALSVQIFLIAVSTPLLLLAALIEERGQTEVALRQSEERFRLAMSAAQIGTWDWRIDPGEAPRSEQTKRPFGMAARDNVVSFERFCASVHPEDRAAVERAIRDRCQDGLPYEMEYRIVRPDGTVRWVLGKGEVVLEAGRGQRMLGISVDITDRKHAEEAMREEATLRASEARFRQLADTMPQFVWAARPDGCVDYYNRRTYELTDVKEGDIGDTSWLHIVHPDDQARCLENWYSAVQSGEPYEIEYRFLMARTGVYRWHLGRALPVRDDAGNIVRWYGTSTDIDDQKRAEEALWDMRQRLEDRVEERTAELLAVNETLREQMKEREDAEQALRASEERSAKAFRSSPDAMVITRQGDGQIIDVNDRWQVLYGYTRSEAVGHTTVELGLCAMQAWHSLAGHIRADGLVRDFELALRARSGEILQTIVTAEATEMGGEACHIAILRDVTAQRRAEREAQEQRREMTRLTRIAMLGQLSGAFAHELNQPLTAILSNAQAAQRFLAREPVDLDEVRDIIDDIVHDDQRAGAVIRRLRALLERGETPIQAVVDVNGVVMEALDLAHGDLVGRNINVATHLAPVLPGVKADQVQLQQVLLNLIVNASEAMTENMPAQRKLVITTKADGAGYVEVAVADHGPGIPVDRLERLFEPFYSAKAHGLGLGLSISRSIVTAHAGRLWAENNADHGATFRLNLPACAA